MCKKNILALLLFFLSHIAFATVSADFHSRVLSIPQQVARHMQRYTWRPGCPVPLSELRYLQLTYWGFDAKPHQGVLIVHAALAQQVLGLFKSLYSHRFPIERMQPMYMFKGNDEKAMELNNTSAFNCRSVTGKPGIYSKHAYGRAIDINTKMNPYVKGKLVLPKNGVAYVNRAIPVAGKITREGIVYRLFVENGWKWGGDWHDLQDYQHFEK